jgi:hypothetical protein
VECERSASELKLEANAVKYRLAALRRALRPCFFGYEAEVKNCRVQTTLNIHLNIN